MTEVDPIHRRKEDYNEIIDKIAQKESAVGIDAQYTHAIIITYLQQLNKRLEKLEKMITMK